MKYRIIYLLRKVFGLKNYLFLFSVLTLRGVKGIPFNKEFSHFISLIPEKGIILDIGANIGLTVVPLAQKKPWSTIFCFEPIPLNIGTLERVIKHFGLQNIKIFKIALGESNGELKMTIPLVQNVLMTGLSHTYKDHVDGETQGEVIVAEMCRLDDIEELKHVERISAIKIDVENFEYYVLKGGQALLIKHMPIIYCELWDNEFQKLTMDYLKSLGYKVKIFDDEKLIDFTNEHFYVNFFFVPPTIAETT